MTTRHYTLYECFEMLFDRDAVRTAKTTLIEVPPPTAESSPRDAAGAAPRGRRVTCTMELQGRG